MDSIILHGIAVSDTRVFISAIFRGGSICAWNKTTHIGYMCSFTHITYNIIDEQLTRLYVRKLLLA